MEDPSLASEYSYAGIERLARFMICILYGTDEGTALPEGQVAVVAPAGKVKLDDADIEGFAELVGALVEA